jgi:hypothetical protein
MGMRWFAGFFTLDVQQLVRHHQRQFASQADAGEQFLAGLQAVVLDHAVPHRRVRLDRFGMERGLIIHTHDCTSIRAFRTDPDKWLDVEWETEPGHMFDVSIKVVVGNQRGVLAKVAAAIAEHGSNIGNIAMEEEDGSPYTVLYFTVQVENRMHLARVMRGLRVLPDVVRIFRIKGKKDGRAAPPQ